MKSKLLSLLFLLLMSGGAMAQIHSGQVAMHYNFPYNGTWCWYVDGFRTGTVRYNGRTYQHVDLNIDAALHALQVRDKDGGVVYLLDPAKVEMLRIGNDDFRYFPEGSPLPEGWYQILFEGNEALYFRIDRTLEQSMQRPSAHILGYEDPDYKENVFNYFATKKRWWHIDAEGAVHQVRSAGRAERMLSRWQKEAGPAPAREIVARNASAAPASARFSEGWFADRTTRPAAESADTTRATVTYQNKVYEIGSAASGKRAQARVSGLITDIKTGAPIEGIAVYDSTKLHWSTTGKDGRYSLILPTGRHTLHYGGNLTWRDADIEIVLLGPGELDIALVENAIDIQGAHISAESLQQHRTAHMGLEHIEMERIRHIPVAFGEADVIKAVLTLPGVQTVGEASSGFNVRGGSVDQNLVLFNGATIYNPNHMFGIFSSFNADVVREAELYKSSIPVEYGGRSSSVLDIRSREGNTERIKGSAGIGLLTSHLCLDGPIGRDKKTTFLLSGRTTYSNWILKLLPENSYYHGSKANFFDVNAGITHRFSEKDKLSFSAYASRDRFTFNPDTAFIYGNLAVSSAWHHRAGENRELSLTVGFDRYDNGANSKFGGEQTDYQLRTHINQGFAKMRFVNRFGQHTLTYGLDALYLMLNPGRMTPASASSLIAEKQLPLQQALEPSIYIGDAWEISDRFLLDGGVRLGAYYAMSSRAFYAMPEVRISARYSILENLTAKAGFNTMRQNIHLITNTSTISPMDTWTLVTDRIKPQDGYQAAGGLYWSIPRISLDISLEGYYKRSWRTLDYVSGASLAMNDHLADDLLETTGTSYGVEVMLRRTRGRLTGWASYTWSRAFLQEMYDYGSRSINNGLPYCAPHDKPHSVKIAANYDITHRYSISANFDWSTGRPVTIPTGIYTYGGKQRFSFSSRNDHRIPNYFRLDLAFNIDPGHYLKQLVHTSFTIGCYNVTGMRNAYSVFYTLDEMGNAQGHMISVFASQIPYVTLNLKF